MIEDKLTRDERIRLEALAQGIASQGMQSLQPEALLVRAKKFEAWIRDGVTS